MILTEIVQDQIIKKLLETVTMITAEMTCSYPLLFLRENINNNIRNSFVRRFLADEKTSSTTLELEWSRPCLATTRRYLWYRRKLSSTTTHKCSRRTWRSSSVFLSVNTARIRRKIYHRFSEFTELSWRELWGDTRTKHVITSMTVNMKAACQHQHQQTHPHSGLHSSL